MTRAVLEMLSGAFDNSQRSSAKIELLVDAAGALPISVCAQSCPLVGYLKVWMPDTGRIILFDNVPPVNICGIRVVEYVLYYITNLFVVGFFK